MKRFVLIRLVSGLLVLALLSVGAYAFSQEVSRDRHPNLAAAQELIRNAIDKITDAQKANRFDMRDHAAKAKQLLEDASHEIWLAAQSANR